MSETIDDELRVTSVRLDPEERRWVRRQAAERDTSMQTVIRSCVREALDRDGRR